MEELEVPTEQAQEEIHHHAKHSSERWIMGVALSSAIIAALAAVTALLAGHHSDEAMINQIQASDQWGYYQAKGIKSAVLTTKIQLLQSFGKNPDVDDMKKIDQYKKDQDEINDKAREKETESKAHLQKHMVLARGVTLFQVAIAVSAISVLTRRRRFWLVSLGFGAIGLFFLLQGIL